LTQGIAKIERWLGMPLFRRGAAGMAPTEPGEIFAIRVCRALDYLAHGAALAAGERTHVHRHFAAGQLRALIAAVQHGGFAPAAVQHGGFAPAARALGRDASNVNRACRDLERLMGAPLFETTTTGIRPTREAEAPSRMGRLAMGEIRQGVDDVNAWRGAHTGRLAIGCLPLAQANILPRALRRFADKHPSMGVVVIDGVYASLARTAARRSRHRHRRAAQRRLAHGTGPERDLLRSAGRGGAARAPAGGRRGGEPRHAGALSLGGPARSGAPARAYFEKLRAGLSPPPGVPRPIETGAHPVMRGALLASDRITLVSMGQARSDVEDGALVRPAIDLPSSARPIGVTARIGWAPGLPQARFLDFVRSAAREAR
jgi:LysR family transcriptional regulator of gallate degradation